MAAKTVSWRITPKNIGRLDKVDGVEDGSVSLHATDLDNASYQRLEEFLVAHGGLLKILKTRTATGSQPRTDLTGVDFAAHCPGLTTLEVARVAFNETLFAHPALTSVRLRESNYTGPREIALGEGPLRKLVFEDCIVDADRVTVAAESGLKTFEFWLDEDFADTCPEDFDLLGTSMVDRTVSAAWNYTVTTDLASKRRLRYETFRAGRYNTGKHVYHGGSKTYTFTISPDPGA